MGCGADGKPVPTELRKEAHALRQQIELEDTRTAQLSTHIDDEYARATEADPKVLLTTSREPSSRLSQFAKVGPLPHPARSPVSFLCLWRAEGGRHSPGGYKTSLSLFTPKEQCPYSPARSAHTLDSGGRRRPSHMHARSHTSGIPRALWAVLVSFGVVGNRCCVLRAGPL
jgi:hypothetical protein